MVPTLQAPSSAVPLAEVDVQTLDLQWLDWRCISSNNGHVVPLRMVASDIRCSCGQGPALVAPSDPATAHALISVDQPPT